jgi:hypothetical protein
LAGNIVLAGEFRQVPPADVQLGRESTVTPLQNAAAVFQEQPVKAAQLDWVPASWKQGTEGPPVTGARLPPLAPARAPPFMRSTQQDRLRVSPQLESVSVYCPNSDSQSAWAPVLGELRQVPPLDVQLGRASRVTP